MNSCIIECCTDCIESCSYDIQMLVKGLNGMNPNDLITAIPAVLDEITEKARNIENKNDLLIMALDDIAEAYEDGYKHAKGIMEDKE